jgi:hypothetical protein
MFPTLEATKKEIFFNTSKPLSLLPKGTLGFAKDRSYVEFANYPLDWRCSVYDHNIDGARKDDPAKLEPLLATKNGR